VLEAVLQAEEDDRGSLVVSSRPHGYEAAPALALDCEERGLPGTPAPRLPSPLHAAAVLATSNAPAIRHAFSHEGSFLGPIDADAIRGMKRSRALRNAASSRSTAAGA